MSYEELLENARDRYRELYRRAKGMPPAGIEPAHAV